MGRLILLRDRELVFSDNLWAGLVSSLGFGEFVLVFIFDIPHIYDTYIVLLCSYFYSDLCPSCSRDLLINIF
jgi:hypothetical protein